MAAVSDAWVMVKNGAFRQARWEPDWGPGNDAHGAPCRLPHPWIKILCRHSSVVISNNVPLNALPRAAIFASLSNTDNFLWYHWSDNWQLIKELHLRAKYRACAAQWQWQNNCSIVDETSSHSWEKLKFELSASAFIPSGDKKFILRDHGAPPLPRGPG